jgi:hypothetical protein
MKPCVFNDELLEYIANSKIVLNTHYYESFLQEQVRIFELLINNKVVISETSRRNNFGDLIYEFTTKEEMIILINNILNKKLWKNANVSERFKNCSYKRFRIGAVYNTFYGLDVIKKSIESIREAVDYIVIVHQKVGFNKMKEPSFNAKILKELETIVNDIIYYDTEVENKQSGVLEKRNIGLDYCIKNRCDFIMPLDADEIYESGKIIEQATLMYNDNIDTLYSPIHTYYYNEDYYYLDTYFVPSIYRINDRRFELTKTSVLTDPVRKMREDNCRLSTMPMHHYSYLKQSFISKLENSVSSSLKPQMKVVYDHLLKWKEGEDGIVFMNDLNDGGNVCLSYVKLKNKK